MGSDIAEGSGAAVLGEAEEERCVYVVAAADGGRERCCGKACRPGSAYCPEHHARCHLRGGSVAEGRRLREIDALAAAAGGRRAREARQPSPGILRRLERIARTVFLHPNRSCNVPNAADDNAPEA